jgi:MFS family permease
MLLLALMYRLTQSRIFKISAAIMAAGMFGLLLCGTSKAAVILFMVVYSAGEHITMPVRSTISLELAQASQGGASLGITGALGHAGNILGFIIVTGLFFVFSRMGFARSDLVQFKVVFALSAALMTAALLISLALKETVSKGTRQRFYVAKKFFKYYMLEVFYGSRKQIFITFAPYVLILQYKADTSVIALLLAVCAVFGVIFSPLIGRLIDRLGYKIIMVTDTLLLMVVCFFYGFAHRLFPPHIAYTVVCANFVLDSIISLASMASNVYVQDIAENQEEITATLSTGISVNHVISIFIALLGGYIWQATGIEALFTLSAFLGLLNTIYAATITVEKKTVR